MEKFIYDESNGLWYELVGDYYFPCLLPPENKQEIGIWGQMYFEFIKQHKKSFYSTLLITDKLNDYLADIDKQANDMYNTIIIQLTKKEKALEKLKEENQLMWVEKMEEFSQIATEIVNTGLMYV